MPSCGNSTPSGPNKPSRCSALANTTDISQGLPRPARVACTFRGEELLPTSCGRICMHRKEVDVSTVMSGKRLALKEGDDAIWVVRLMH